MWDCSIHVVKTKALISCAVTAQLICVFVSANAKSRFSHDAARDTRQDVEIVHDLGFSANRFC